jgi:hypothetical protein
MLDLEGGLQVSLLASKVSLGRSSRREGSLEASHTSAILIIALLYYMLYIHLTFQLAYIVWIGQ